jgi:kinesin family protein 1
MIKITNLQTQAAWLWDIGKLMNRRYLIQDIYQKYLEGDDSILTLRKEEDPFWDSVEDLFIGMGRFFLHSLLYGMEFQDKAFISDYGVEFFKLFKF